jgi:phosphoglycolate phosphatase
MPPVVVFDLDGTLADSAPSIALALNRLREGRGLAPWSVARARPWVSRGAPALVGAALELAGPASVQDVAAFRELYGALPGSTDDLYPGIADALATLRAAGAVLGVCTNKPQRLSNKVLADSGIARHFVAVVGGDAASQAKPHPAHLRQTLAAMRCEGRPFTFVGDSSVDADAADAAGARFLWASWGYADADDLARRGTPLASAADLAAAILGVTRA